MIKTRSKIHKPLIWHHHKASRCNKKLPTFMVSNLNAWQIMQMGAYAPSSINLIHETYLIIYILTLMEFDNDLPNQVWKLHHPYSAHPKSCYIYIVNLKRQISTLEMAVDGFSWEISNNGRWSTLSNVVCTRLHRRVTHGGAVFKPLKRP